MHNKAVNDGRLRLRSAACQAFGHIGMRSTLAVIAHYHWRYVSWSHLA